MDKEEKIIEAQEAAELATTPAPTESKALIVVTQLPIIEEHLRDFKAEAEKIAAEAKSMVATAETVQAVKNHRAALNKQFDLLEDQRKAVKKQIMAPYDNFNAVYRECVEKPFSEATASLNKTVDAFEFELKQKAMDKLEKRYAELCEREHIDWLPFKEAMKQIGIDSAKKIPMDDAKKKEPTKTQNLLDNFVCKIAMGRDAVEQMEDSAEIMVVYKQTLDAGRAAAIVADTHRRIAAEKEAAARREEQLAREREMVAKVETLVPDPVEVASPENFPDRSVTPPPAEKTWAAFTFTVYNCTRSQLIGIREYLKQEGIRYE